MQLFEYLFTYQSDKKSKIDENKILLATARASRKKAAELEKSQGILAFIIFVKYCILNLYDDLYVNTHIDICILISMRIYICIYLFDVNHSAIYTCVFTYINIWRCNIFIILSDFRKRRS
jgi:hypothetical protein